MLVKSGMTWAGRAMPSEVLSSSQSAFSSLTEWCGIGTKKVSSKLTFLHFEIEELMKCILTRFSNSLRIW